jgi:hypothetical protein
MNDIVRLFFSAEMVYVFSYDVTMKGLEGRALLHGENFEGEE